MWQTPFLLEWYKWRKFHWKISLWHAISWQNDQALFLSLLSKVSSRFCSLKMHSSEISQTWQKMFSLSTWIIILEIREIDRWWLPHCEFSVERFSYEYSDPCEYRAFLMFILDNFRKVVNGAEWIFSLKGKIFPTNRKLRFISCRIKSDSYLILDSIGSF